MLETTLAKPLPGQSAVAGARRAVFVALAAVSFLFGLVGAVLPGLPTTPFWLLAAWLLSRSSPRLHRALLASRWAGPVLRDWHQHRAVSVRVKRRAIVVVAALLAFAAVTSRLPAWGLGCAVCGGLAGMLIVSRLPTLPSETE